MQPLISIITVCYNAGQLLQKTIDSVRAQTYADIEYIVIDGGSGQETLDVIEKNKDRIQTLLIEKDHGIYDAMNKGLKLATGDFVWFLNAGDLVYDAVTTSFLAAQIDEGVDVLFGDAMLVNEDYLPIGLRSDLSVHALPVSLSFSSMRFGMVVCHQSLLVRRSLAPEYILNNLSADIDWLIQVLKRARGKIVNANLTICQYLMGGISKQKHRQSLNDRYDILKQHFGFWPNLFNHFLIVMRAVWHKLIKKSSY